MAVRLLIIGPESHKPKLPIRMRCRPPENGYEELNATIKQSKSYITPEKKLPVETFVGITLLSIISTIEPFNKYRISTILVLMRALFGGT